MTVKTWPLALIALLCGCATYKVALTKTDGTSLTASATSLTATGSVALSVGRDAKGEIQTLTFLRSDSLPLDLLTKGLGK
jgi:hypothetical protein